MKTVFDRAVVITNPCALSIAVMLLMVANMIGSEHEDDCDAAALLPMETCKRNISNVDIVGLLFD